MSEDDDGVVKAGDTPRLATKNDDGDAEAVISNGNAGPATDDSGAGAYDKDNPFFKSLWHGFHALRETRDDRKKPLFALKSEETSDDTKSDSKQFSGCATVNFIDPTTIGSPNQTSSSNMLSSAAQKKALASTPKIQNVYEKLTFIFRRDYATKLKNVPYKNIRSGSNEIISSLPVRPVLTRSHGTAGSANGGVNVPWGGTAGSAAATVSDPSEWHNGPYCHVYIAACESIEHYRTKIRPSLQAFVSQIEAAATNYSTSSSSAHYLIVYLPCGPKLASREPEGSNTTTSVGNAFASRLQKARQRIANMNNNAAEMSNDSIHSADSFDSQDLAIDGNGEGDPGTAVINMLPKRNRDIYKKISTDFPNGKVCVLSPSSLDTSDDEDVSDSGLAVKTQEWSSFNRSLGSVIVNGFKDRCRRYNEELRRLDSQRMAPKQAPPNSRSKRANTPAFNLSHFFLVKESLAFTFEQMQLPSEALLQYDEFRAFLPDAPTKPGRRPSKKTSTKSASDDQPDPPLIQLADAGDYVGFRRRIRSEPDLAPILDVVKRYLFARELSLLFKMDQPVELLSRCLSFLESIYAAKMRGLEDMDEGKKLMLKVEAAEWAVNFLWDVKCAADRFFTSFASRESTISVCDTVSVDTLSVYSDASLDAESQSEKAVARRLSELLEIARLFLKQLGDTQLEGENPARIDERWVPEDMFTSWGPWKPRQSRTSILSFQKLEGWNGNEEDDVEPNRTLFLDSAYSSTEAFEMKYLELTLSVVSLCRYSDRRRVASRLQGEVAEYFIRQGDFKHAAAIIKAIVKKCRVDQWDRCHFWRLFRLVYCQRTTARSTDYLKTLVTCFSPRIAEIAPPKALNILQDDLEVVMEDSHVGEARYGKLAFIETQLEILETAADESTIGTGAERKTLLKQYCSVGENIRVVLTVNCHLPRSIYLQSLRLFVVTFADFSAILEKRESVEEEDTFRIIALEAPVEVKPGSNKYFFDWVPMSAGQYILSTVEMKWKQGYFYYDSMELEGPLLGVDVHPNDATHSLTIEPSSLVPGHNQQVKITFNSGTDLVTGVKLQLKCTGGLQLIPPGEDPESADWQNGSEMEFESCTPGEQKTLITYVKCNIQEVAQTLDDETSSTASGDHNVPGVSVRAFTTYVHSQVNDSDRAKIPHMKTVLETAAVLLETTALTVEDVDVVWQTAGDRVMVRILLLCHSLSVFEVDDLQLYLPAPLQVAGSGDLNGDFVKCSVSKGVELALAFECVVGAGQETKSADEPILNLKLRDEVGKICSLSLPLDLDDAYQKLQERGMHCASLSAILQIGSNEGNVGDPVTMTFVIYTDGLAKLAEPNEQSVRLLYTVSSKETPWLMGGKVSGLLACTPSTEVSFDLVGIPTFAGMISQFPRLDLKYQSPGGSKPLAVKFECPQGFKSRNILAQVAVASAVSPKS